MHQHAIVADFDHELRTIPVRASADRQTLRACSDTRRSTLNAERILGVRWTHLASPVD
jgi:hypothetical protein